MFSALGTVFGTLSSKYVFEWITVEWAQVMLHLGSHSPVPILWIQAHLTTQASFV